jgi:hypothetical protein
MSTVDRFTFFHALPPELRLQIWGEALSVRSVWAASPNDNKSRVPFNMVYIGPAPYLAGLTCREARRLLVQFYVKPIHGPFTGLGTSSSSHWVNVDTTVIDLGGYSDATTILDAFGGDELSRFKHVALLWHQFGSVVRICMRLATMCPALCTIIIQRSNTEAPTHRSFRQPLSIEMAACYATVIECAGPEIECEEVDTPYFRSLILEHFGDSPPKLHLLSPGFTKV